MNAPAILEEVEPLNAWKVPVEKLENISMISHLYNRFDGMYPNIFRANFRGGANAIANWEDAWADAFEEEGVVPADLKKALSECRKRFDKPPSLPEFLKAIKPVLDPALQLQVAIVQWGNRHHRRGENWPDCRTFWTAYRMQYDLLNTEAKYLKGQWLAKWAEAEADAGKPIPVMSPVEAIEHKKATMTKEEAKRHASSISLSIGMSATSWTGTYCPNDNRVTLTKRIKALQQLRIAIPAKIHTQAVKMGLGEELGLVSA
jgi:hypothetical protein